MSDHTQGPWNYGEDKRGSFRVFAGEYEIVRALSKHGMRRLSLKERLANALLIAAAPDLLQALQAVMAVADRKTDEFDMARAAIAKAEGRT